jgi:hypothetical protein
MKLRRELVQEEIKEHEAKTQENKGEEKKEAPVRQRKKIPKKME